MYLSLKGFVDSSHQVSGNVCLCHIARSSGRKSRIHEIAIVMHGQEYYFGADLCSLELTGCLQAIRDGHRYIDYEYIGIQAQCLDDRVPAVTHGPYDFEVVAQNTRNSCHDRRMIIGK